MATINGEEIDENNVAHYSRLFGAAIGVMAVKLSKDEITPDEYFDFMDEYVNYRTLAEAPEPLRKKIIELGADK